MISIVIVHYKTPELLLRCLESLEKQKEQAFEIIIIDNENHPDLPHMIAAYPHILLIQNKKNIGYGRANNQAAAIAKGDYFFLLNPDAYLKDPTTLSTLLKKAKAHAGLGIMGLKILNDHGEETMPPRRFYPGLKYYKGPLFQELPGDIAWTVGAGMLIPKKVYEAVSGFDPDFFLYGDEVDLCLRVRKKGYTIAYCQEAAIMHTGGASEKTISEYDYWLKKQRGLYLFYIKHYPPDLWHKILRKELLRANYRLFLLWFRKKWNKTKTIQMKWERNSAIKESVLRTFADPNWLQYFDRENP